MNCKCVPSPGAAGKTDDCASKSTAKTCFDWEKYDPEKKNENCLWTDVSYSPRYEAV